MTLLLIAIGLAATIYVHVLIGSRTTSAAQAWAVRLILVLVAAVFGIIWSASIQQPSWLGFVAGFGIVHIPPAAVLFLKRQRPARQYRR